MPLTYVSAGSTVKEVKLSAHTLTWQSKKVFSGDFFSHLQLHTHRAMLMPGRSRNDCAYCLQFYPKQKEKETQKGWKFVIEIHRTYNKPTQVDSRYSMHIQATKQQHQASSYWVLYNKCVCVSEWEGGWVRACQHAWALMHNIKTTYFIHSGGVQGLLE